MTEFDKDGYPILSISENKIVSFIPDDSGALISSNNEQDTTPVNVSGYNVIPWFANNDFPQIADSIIYKTPVLKRALRDLTKVTLGQGVFPCEVIDTIETGQEVLKMIKDPIVTGQLNSYIIRRYLAKINYDINSFGNAFIQFQPNLEGNQILNLIPVNALHCRLEAPDKNGKINNVIVSGTWPNPVIGDIGSYTLLDEIDPMSHLMLLKDAGKLKKSVFMHLKSSFSSNDFYPLPDWYTAKRWIDISNNVPKIIKAGMDNVLNIFYLVRIPRSYWDWKYPEDQLENKERKEKIQADIDKLEKEFTSVENAKKALITHFGLDESGSDDKWDIEIKQPIFNQENFVTSTAADTQIAIAAGYNPDLLGLMYGNSKGGSMQRELLLLQYALSWESRQQLADPIEMMLKFNNPGLTNMVLRFRNTFLTTLDTGAGTAQTLS
jgi:hypothetical protein